MLLSNIYDSFMNNFERLMDPSNGILCAASCLLPNPVTRIATSTLDELMNENRTQQMRILK
jgi:hypothetical protein